MKHIKLFESFSGNIEILNNLRDIFEEISDDHNITIDYRYVKIDYSHREISKTIWGLDGEVITKSRSSQLYNRKNSDPSIQWLIFGNGDIQGHQIKETIESISSKIKQSESLCSIKNREPASWAVWDNTRSKWISFYFNDPFPDNGITWSDEITNWWTSEELFRINLNIYFE